MQDLVEPDMEWVKKERLKEILLNPFTYRIQILLGQYSYHSLKWVLI
jgi:hypothetical protein